MAMRRVNVIVAGTVQGVGYRFTTAQEAQRLGVSGWVRNLHDGRVEAELEGEEHQVDALLAWMSKGPPYAEVTASRVSERTPKGTEGFRVVR
ncbi:acylphosphatase [Pseudoclavibacter sp. RFBJ3]|nr:acylphosphatase [Pseudoclavibacter sp. VKM Ac-2888]PPF34015.1 acylphosphatase [Pseudoclavibacter sp. AY1H1]PPF76680.1 acylphosphatase [Pseudoclavibacter sp. Z016]PPF85350.1 acylphosphatase [Pseudoclavibacter sp. RFBJ5]PPF93255.1 acylphosphatase [Pseudoclavibacter sp. RFBJ3]PPF98901.1 acylphosphatase [Pseudoclavibacter sp. RFBH5]PPG03954.1 acylphosphatase [Pseudoclavibacter sp. RFBI5]PPG24966.1 acylphosphatase [Pseudoclavibacter sp. RFBI4]PPG32452.1 acylphosphatase [Pseudoclavibacter sp. 